MRLPGPRFLLLRAAYLLLLLAWTPARGGPVTAVGEVAVTVSDADRALAFYRDVLGFTLVGEAEQASEAVERLEGVFGARVRVLHLRLGEERVALLHFLAPAGRRIPEGLRSNDGGFQHLAIVVSDLDLAYRRLREHGVRHVSSGPQTLPAWNRNAGGIRAFYFADPDGHTLELIWFPPGKGDPRWQRPGAPLFQGLDHTAIGVRDTEAALRLYRDALGLRVAGESETWGPEQAHLNAVFGAHLRITALRAAAGPGIELLEYLAPRDGRPAPEDLRANDLLHWQTALRVEDVAQAQQRALGAAARRVSSEPVRFAEVPFEGQAGALVRDADGHALLLVH